MPPLDNDIAELAKEVKSSLTADFDRKTDVLRELADKALTEAGRGITATNGFKEKLDEAMIGMNEVKTSITTLEQKLARAEQFKGDAAAAKSLGRQFVESDEVKNFLATDTKRGKVQLLLKAVMTSATADAAGAVGAALNATRLPGIVEPARRRLFIRDLILPGTMDQSSLEYVQETGFTNSAAPVAENGSKPQSDIKLALKTSNARVIAHTAKASRQMLDDVSMLQSYIDGRMRYMLAFKEEQQILSGDGTGQNLNGIIPQATAYSAPATISSPTAIDILRLAILQVMLSEFPGDAIVLHPTDWGVIELLKDSTGRYIIGNPSGAGTPSLWRLPVVETQAITVDKFLVGAFGLGAQVFDRWTARVEIATENEDDFVKNMITMLCEERIALAVYRPEAFVYGDLGRVA